MEAVSTSRENKVVFDKPFIIDILCLIAFTVGMVLIAYDLKYNSMTEVLIVLGVIPKLAFIGTIIGSILCVAAVAVYVLLHLNKNKTDVVEIQPENESEIRSDVKIY